MYWSPALPMRMVLEGRAGCWMQGVGVGEVKCLGEGRVQQGSHSLEKYLNYREST